jgi:hypothetical protein
MPTAKYGALHFQPGTGGGNTTVVGNTTQKQQAASEHTPTCTHKRGYKDRRVDLALRIPTSSATEATQQQQHKPPDTNQGKELRSTRPQASVMQGSSQTPAVKPATSTQGHIYTHNSLQQQQQQQGALSLT